MVNQEPFVTIPLRDGTSATVGFAGVRVGDRTFALADIQDARQVAPDPVTVALRVANERHVVELQPTQPGDGALFLEAVFRLRPELRPAGFESPAMIPPEFPPQPSPVNQLSASTPWGAHPSWPPHPGMYPPPSGATVPQPMPRYTLPRYTPQGNTGGRLTPYARSTTDAMGAIFALFTAHWRRWLLLGVVALFVPQVINGAVDALFHVLGRNDLWAGLPLTTAGGGGGALGIGSTTLPEGSDLLLTALNLLISAAMSTLIGGWSAAVVGSAGRDALFGRTPQIGAAMRAGLKRLFPAVGASILNGLILLLILLPLIALYSILLTQYGYAIKDPNSLDSSSPAGATFNVLGCLILLLLLPSVIVAIYVNFRLILAPYIATTESLGPVAAVRRSWNLTRRQWGHTFWPIFVVTLLSAIIAFPASFTQYASFGIATLVVIPLAAALTRPIVDVGAIVVLYDLRLRREGFASLAREGAGGEPTATPI